MPASKVGHVCPNYTLIFYPCTACLSSNAQKLHRRSTFVTVSDHFSDCCFRDLKADHPYKVQHMLHTGVSTRLRDEQTPVHLNLLHMPVTVGYIVLGLRVWKKHRRLQWKHGGELPMAPNICIYV